MSEYLVGALLVIVAVGSVLWFGPILLVRWAAGNGPSGCPICGWRP